MNSQTFEPPGIQDTTLLQIGLAPYILPTLMAADEIGLFALLARIPLAVAEIAPELGVSFRGAEAMVATLASLGLLIPFDGKFHLTDISRTYLVPGKPFYWGDVLAVWRKVQVTSEGLLTAMRRDTPPPKQDGTSATIDEWAAAKMTPDRALAITRAMHNVSFALGTSVARTADLSGTRRVLDMAGGSGCYCIAMAQRHPGIHFTVAELEPVCAVAQQIIDQYGLREHIDTLAIDMFRDPWPAGYDAILLNGVLHDWDKARRQHLLRRSFEALPPGGRLLISEMLLSDSQDGPLGPALLSMAMTFSGFGKQFTVREISAELAEGGFRDISVAQTRAPDFALVSAVKPNH